MYRSTSLVVASATAFILCAGSARAADPVAKCEAGKLQASAQYASCRLKAEAKAAKKGTVADYGKCVAAFTKKFTKAESKAGPGVCPSEGDLAKIDTTVARYTSNLASLVTATTDGCPAGYATRTPSQVVTDLWNAVLTNDTALIACNYHDNAFLTDDQGVLVGTQDIIASYQSLMSLFNFIAPTLKQKNEFQDVVRYLYSLDAGWIVIEDGVDTFLIEAGRIRSQTRHGLITFTGPPSG